MELSNRNNKEQPAIITISEGGDIESPYNRDKVTSLFSSNLDLDDLHNEVSQRLLGQPLKGHRQFFYMLDPFYQSQLVRSPKLFEDINIYFGIIYFISIFAFIVYAFYKYITQIPVQTNTMILSSTINPIYVNITLSCSNPYQCGLWSNNSTGTYILEKPIVFSQVWKNVPQESPCFGKDSTINLPALSSNWYTIATVCYSDSPSDGLLFSVPFNSSLAEIKFIITGDSKVYNKNKNMYNELDINPNQWKTAFLSQTKSISTDKVITYAPYVGDLFYNGHPSTTTLGYSSTVRLRLLQFSYLSVTSNQQNIFSTFGSIGGFTSFSVTVLGITRTVIILIYKSWYEISDSTSKKGIRANVCQLLFLCITKLLSFKS